MKANFKLTLTLLVLFSFQKTSAQEIELLRKSMSQEDYMILLIDSLNYSLPSRDTAAIIQFSRILVTEFQSARMKDRASEYLNMAIQYSTSYSDPKPYFDMCNRAGMYYSSRMRDYGIGTDYYFDMIKEERRWHNQAINNDVGNMRATFWGHFGVLMNMKMVFDDNGIENDSMVYHYKRMVEISLIDSTNSMVSTSKNYIGYLTAIGRFREADSLIHDIIPHFSDMQRKEQSAYLNAIHDLIARQNGLDTLIALRKNSVSRFAETTASGHQEKLYNADQKFEVTKTKDVLENTQLELDQSNRIIILAITLAVFILLISIYFYHLNKKNKRLSLRNELLLKEQNHRVKNNLQMINSLLSLQSQKLLSTDAKEALNESQLRINSVALLHRMLYEGDQLGQVNTKEYLSTLTDEIKYAVLRKIDLVLTIPDDLHLAIEKATSLGLIVNELMTNSIKHVGGDIALIIHLVLKEESGELTLNYSDNGSGISEEVWNTSNSFGNQLIRIQSEQLRGKYAIRKDEGFSYELRLGA